LSVSTDRGESDAFRRHRSLGLTDEEYDMIVGILGRGPTDTELAMYSVMWSEHCSYKSSRVHLARLPTKAPHVLIGPGENAGVIDVGDGIAVAVRIESHNHPSYIEPYQGAATGVGGILRDIFTMGARPIALMDALFFGPPEDARSRFILDGVVRGIAGYGNAVGVPTVGGQTTIDSTYRSNPLVNVFCLGLLPISRLVLSSASGVGNLAVLLGSRTGRDGIGGVSVLASAGFAEADAAGQSAKRPSVQISDPYEEKRLIETCLELFDAGLVVGIQDLGGAGLACATSESAAHAGLGMDVDVARVPRREPGMSPAEVMTSESQERMLAIVVPGSLPAVEEVCRRWEVEATAIGVVTAPDASGVGRLRILDGDEEIAADVPAATLADLSPRYRRPMSVPADLAARRADDPSRKPAPADPGQDLLALLSDPAPIYRQYDHQLFLNTVVGPGEGDATVLKLAAPGIPWRNRALAMSADANPGWCAVDPRAGTAATVAESALNVSCTGAIPLALVNCLNFGNPEHPEVMWQLSEAIDGMSEACEALGIPVVGGNVSLYDESGGCDIDPTPVVAVVGLISRLVRKPPVPGWQDGDSLVVVGAPGKGLAGSRWARSVAGCTGGVLTAVDLASHRELCRFIRELVARETGDDDPPRLVSGLHDVGDGGLGVALAECARMARRGAEVAGVVSHEDLFAELPLRVLVATPLPEELIRLAANAGIPTCVVGTVGGERLVVRGVVDCSLDELDGASSGIAAALEARAPV
jgi:phosphoribosylformylglycinamidine synthase